MMINVDAQILIRSCLSIVGLAALPVKKKKEKKIFLKEMHYRNSSEYKQCRYSEPSHGPIVVLIRQSPCSIQTSHIN